MEFVERAVDVDNAEAGAFPEKKIIQRELLNFSTTIRELLLITKSFLSANLPACAILMCYRLTSKSTNLLLHSTCYFSSFSLHLDIF